MGTLYIDRKDLSVEASEGTLVFRSSSGEPAGKVPLNPVRRVVMVGTIRLDASVLHALGERGVSVVFLSGKRLRYRGVFTGPLHNNGALRLNQYRFLSCGEHEQEARRLVRRKIAGQRDLLAEAREARPDLRFSMTRALRTLDKAVDLLDGEPELPLDSLRGIEGSAAAAYFEAYTELFPPSLGFDRRVRRPPTDPVNAMLSLLYTFLHWECVREVQTAGLDPTLGLYHTFEYGRESLACDLVEVFRPRADRWVWGLFRDRTFTGRDFSSDDERAGTYLKKEARKRFFPLYEEWAGPLRREIVSDVRELCRRIGGEAAAEIFEEVAVEEV